MVVYLWLLVSDSKNFPSCKINCFPPEQGQIGGHKSLGPEEGEEIGSSSIAILLVSLDFKKSQRQNEYFN